MSEYQDIRTKLDEDVDKKIASSFGVKDEDEKQKLKEGASSLGKIIANMKEAMAELTEAHLCISWASILPARKDDIYRWCDVLNIPPATIYAYTWMDEDFYIVPESHLLRQAMYGLTRGI